MNRHHSAVRTARRCAIATATVAVATLTLPGVAQAHVSVQPGEVEGGGFSVVTFRVPNERDDASTAKVRVLLPEDQPVGSVQTTPVPGWRIATETRTLTDPIEMFGREVDTVVSQITWTATGDGVQPGQFQDFPVSMGQLPESGELVFRAVQTYSTGERVNWTEVSLDDSVEPEHPAPILRLTSPAEGTDGAAPAGGAAAGVAQDAEIRAAAADTGGDGVAPALPTALSAAALLVALGALGLAWRKGRA